MLETLTVWDVELTDTFGGEANYSWVRRDQLALPQDASRRSVIMAAKASSFGLSDHALWRSCCRPTDWRCPPIPRPGLVAGLFYCCEIVVAKIEPNGRRI